ncbi:MAG TPA: hypothetical protein DCP92_24460 [Nitrospiraceae bacterium]|jgi:hypothetical protein|nr:hypothetical protein [Nitrospiraceae bacterium]
MQPAVLKVLSSIARSLLNDSIIINPNSGKPYLTLRYRAKELPIIALNEEEREKVGDDLFIKEEGIY